MIGRRRAILEQPQSIDEARARLIEVTAEIDTIKAMMEAGQRLRDDGLPMTPDEFLDWHRRAAGSVRWFAHERAMLNTYIAAYEKDIRAEEKAERLATQRRDKEGEIRRNEELIRQWKEELARLDPTRPLTRKEQHERTQLEIQIAKTMRVLASGAGSKKLQIEAQERKRLKREAHEQLMLRDAQLRADEPIDVNDPYNLLRHAFRAMRQLAVSERVKYTENENALLSLIQRACERSLEQGE